MGSATSRCHDPPDTAAPSPRDQRRQLEQTTQNRRYGEYSAVASAQGEESPDKSLKIHFPLYTPRPDPSILTLQPIFNNATIFQDPYFSFVCWPTVCLSTKRPNPELRVL